jgi:protein-L-isoaspartate(D-aspartate) O-methyltransferase
MDEYGILRKKMVDRLRDHYRIQDEKVLEVMNRVPRHLFVPAAIKHQEYKDNALPIEGQQTISQPYIVARMTELLELKPSAKVLEIGAGSGYQTVVLSQIAQRVFAIERVPQLCEEAQDRLTKLGITNVNLKCADGTVGWEVYAPFDGILVAAGSPDVPTPLVYQLKVGGHLVIPIGEDQKSQRLVRITRTEKEFVTQDFGACAFVPLIGEHGWKVNHERK